MKNLAYYAITVSDPARFGLDREKVIGQWIEALGTWRIAAGQVFVAVPDADVIVNQRLPT